MEMGVQQTAGREALGDFAPEFARLNDDVLFGEVWDRTAQLSLRDRSLVTVTALMAQGMTDSSFSLSSGKREKERHNQNRDSRNPDSCRFLCRMAEGMGCIPHGKRSLGRRA